MKRLTSPDLHCQSDMRLSWGSCHPDAFVRCKQWGQDPEQSLRKAQSPAQFPDCPKTTDQARARPHEFNLSPPEDISCTSVTGRLLCTGQHFSWKYKHCYTGMPLHFPQEKNPPLSYCAHLLVSCEILNYLQRNNISSQKDL